MVANDGCRHRRTHERSDGSEAAYGTFEGEEEEYEGEGEGEVDADAEAESGDAEGESGGAEEVVSPGEDGYAPASFRGLGMMAGGMGGMGMMGAMGGMAAPSQLVGAGVGRMM